MPHIHEAIDFVVNVYIVHDDKVLFILHKKLNRWLPIGGHIELNENPEESLFREVKEECGLEITLLGERPSFRSDWVKPLVAPVYMDIHKYNETHRHIALTYFAKTDSADFVFNKEEHKDIKWFSRTDMDDPKYNIEVAVKFYAQKALES